MIKTIFYLHLITVVLFASSCTTIIRGVNPNKQINIAGYPEGASVYVKNKLIGTAPINYQLKNRKALNFTVKKDGFQENHYPLKTKKSIGWTAASVGMGFLGAFIPTIIDAQTGAMNQILTDSIQYVLKPDINNLQKDSTKISPSYSSDNPKNQSVNKQAFSEITNPAISIRTKGREVIIQPKSAVSVWTNNGNMFSGAVGKINSNSLQLIQGAVEIQYSNIKSIRIYPTRRWYPIVTSVTVIPPLIWYISSKNYYKNSNNCKREIITIETIDFVQQRVFGKPLCD